MEQEKKNVYVCPVCGRFTKKAAVDRYSAALAELRSKVQKEITKRKEAESDFVIVKNNLERSVQEDTRLQTKISNHDAEVAKLHKTIDDQAKHILGLEAEIRITRGELTTAREQLDIAYRRNWWQRLLNIYPDDE